jgi:CheY-like chemotaxis protein
MARVLIVDDSESMRLLVRLTLEMDPSLEVVGEAADGRAGLARADELDPDLIVMDLSMPVMDGIEATRRIKEKRPEVGIVAFSAATEEAVIGKALAAGARTSIDKEDVIGLLHVLQDLAVQHDAAGVGPQTVIGVRDLWGAARGGVRTAAAWIGSFTQRLGRAEMAGAFGIGAAAAMAVLMFMVVLPTDDRGPSSVAQPDEVIGPETSLPEVGSVDLEVGDIDISTMRNGERKRRNRDTQPSGTLEVAIVPVDTGTSSGPPSVPPSGSPGPSSGGDTRGDHEPGMDVPGTPDQPDPDPPSPDNPGNPDQPEGPGNGSGPSGVSDGNGPPNGNGPPIAARAGGPPNGNGPPNGAGPGRPGPPKGKGPPK